MSSSPKCSEQPKVQLDVREGGGRLLVPFVLPTHSKVVEKRDLKFIENPPLNLIDETYQPLRQRETYAPLTADLMPN